MEYSASLVYLIGLVTICLANNQNGSQDYCLLETFHATCPEGQVIVMTSAKYGHMGRGKCVDYASDDCVVEALPYLEAACSGKRVCDYTVADRDLDKADRCTKNIRPYLRASYECMPVESAGSCRGLTSVQTIGSRGALASSVSRDSGCGSVPTPWTIPALTGQSIHVSLVDYTANKRNVMTGSAEPECVPVGYVTVDSPHSNKTICPSNHHSTTIHSHQGSSIHVQFLPQTPDDRFIPEYLIEFEVLGCADLMTPENAWYKRTGDNASIGCKHRNMTWHLVCEGNRWNGVVGKCNGTGGAAIAGTEKPVVAPKGKEKDKENYDFIILVALVGGLAIIFIVLATVGIYKLIEHKQRKARRLNVLKMKVDNSTARRYTNEPQRNVPLLQHDQNPMIIQLPAGARTPVGYHRTLPPQPKGGDGGQPPPMSQQQQPQGGTYEKPPPRGPQGAGTPLAHHRTLPVRHESPRASPRMLDGAQNTLPIVYQPPNGNTPTPGANIPPQTSSNGEPAYTHYPGTMYQMRADVHNPPQPPPPEPHSQQDLPPPPPELLQDSSDDGESEHMYATIPAFT